MTAAKDSRTILLECSMDAAYDEVCKLVTNDPTFKPSDFEIYGGTCVRNATNALVKKT